MGIALLPGLILTDSNEVPNDEPRCAINLTAVSLGKVGLTQMSLNSINGSCCFEKQQFSS